MKERALVMEEKVPESNPIAIIRVNGLISFGLLERLDMLNMKFYILVSSFYLTSTPNAKCISSEEAWMLMTPALSFYSL